VKKILRALIKELDKEEQDKEDLKNTYNNYFLEVQNLTNQKVIRVFLIWHESTSDFALRTLIQNF